MKKIILDCDHRNTADMGLLFFCINLGKSLTTIFEKENNEMLRYFVRPNERHRFQVPNSAVYLKKWYSRYLLLFNWNCDIWHASSYGGRSIPRLPGRTKVVLTVHEWPGEDQLMSEPERLEQIKHLGNLVADSDVIVCVTEYIQRQVKHHLKVNSKPVHVIFNGSNEVPDAPPYPVKYRPYLPFIFSIGDVQPKKQFHTLLALLKDQAIELVIAGRILDKDYAAEIRQLAFEANVSDRIRLLGAISDSDKAWYYRNCKAFAFPSTSAGSGAPLMEAMKYGKPVFLSDGSGLSEIGAEECFYFETFDPDDMFQTFQEGLQNFQRLNMATRMMSRARLFNWEDKAAEYAQLYRTILG